MTKRVVRSSLMVSVELTRDVDEDGDTGPPVIRASVTLDKTFWIDGGTGAYTEQIWNHVDELGSGSYILVTNDDDVIHAETYNGITAELGDRLEKQINRVMYKGLDLDE